MIRIFNASISTYAQYEGRLNDAYNEYGTDLKVLQARVIEAAAKIAPESEWKHVGYTMECSVDGTDYVMSTEEVVLVC